MLLLRASMALPNGLIIAPVWGNAEGSSKVSLDAIWCYYSIKISAARPAPLITGEFLVKTLILMCLVVLSGLVNAQPLEVKVLDDGGSGPYRAVATTEPSLRDYVVYRPQNLSVAAQAEGPLPLVVFANGGCNDTSFPFERMLSELASHGYVVIALGAMQQSLDDRPLQKAGNNMITAALDWAREQAAAELGDYYQMVDTGRIASAGQSCGGAQLLATASEPRFSTYLMFNSGIGDMHMAAASRASLTNLHGPVIYLVGGDTGVATDNEKLDYQRIEHVPVVFLII